MTYERTPGFVRHPEQDQLLRELNSLLRVAEEQALPTIPPRPEQPVVFIVGPPRSGTTLMLQWLAASGSFAYPTNLLSRFFGAPYIGARIQQLLTDPAYDYRDELLGLHSQSDFTWQSEIGKTRGILEPHEFFYFWRQFFPVDQAEKLTEDQLQRSDPDGFAAGWASLEHAFGKPVAAKGILLQYDIAKLAEWLPTSIFIHTRREPFFNIQSLLQARQQVYGSKDAWFSVRPPEYRSLKEKSRYIQVAGQVFFTNRSIEQELEALPPHRKILVDYELFCERPASVWLDLQRCFSAFASTLKSYDGPARFRCTNVNRSSPSDCRLINEAHQLISENSG